ncbi:MAG: hypothetical protein JW795_22115 [Chitinivibrionales bacterium]|nr:hypothetical protein [Chitinivibrionales bacterium]
MHKTYHQKCTGIITVVFLFFFISGVIAQNTATDKKSASSATDSTSLSPQTTCPVLGNAIDKKYYVDFNGKRIYLCCPSCKEAVTADPQKYLKKLAQLGQMAYTIEPSEQSMNTKALKPQSTCPIMGSSINKKLFVDYNGQRIYVCCAGCLPEVKKNPQAAIKKLQERGEGIETVATAK